ncbi:hypothetical protein C0Q58_25710 [Streptomyces albidoflavus]|nr:hypothetical protein C0Q58_25710 [Streptomyces albidoflavus]
MTDFEGVPGKWAFPQGLNCPVPRLPRTHGPMPAPLPGASAPHPLRVSRCTSPNSCHSSRPRTAAA